jgi:hypothetical protein
MSWSSFGFIVQIAIGAAAWGLMASLVRERLLGEALGFLAMWVVFSHLRGAPGLRMLRSGATGRPA